MLTLYGLDKPVSSFTRYSWCETTRGTGNPMIEWFCERAPATDWLRAFKVDNGYTYRHQRCSWENPDTAPDVHGPAVDYLFLKALATQGSF